jgi:N-acetylneuraminic acid mutarotase
MKKLLFLLLVILSFATNAQVWTQKVNFAGTAAWGAVSFSIGNKGYMGTGETSTGYSQEFWEYDPFIDTWTQKANFGGGWRGRAVAFAIGNKGYVGTGQYAGSLADFWEYDPLSNTWTQKANFGGGQGIMLLVLQSAIKDMWVPGGIVLVQQIFGNMIL